MDHVGDRCQRTCKDGTKYTVTYNYSWDAAMNTGWRSYSEPGVCGDKARAVAVPFTLVKQGPPPSLN